VEFARKFLIPVAHASYDALLTDPTVDAIYNSLPNSMHHEWTIKALKAGKHVLCEKPISIDAAQAEEMYDVAERQGRVLVEAFMYRSHPQTAAVLHAVKSGAIGQLKMIRTAFCYRASRIDGNIRFNPALAGGAIMDVGCYCTSFSRFFAGQEPAIVQAVSHRHERGIDDVTAGTLLFPNGIVATFVCGMSVQADNTAMLCGTEGYVEIPWPWKPQIRQAAHTIAHSIPPRQDQPISGQPVSSPPPRDTRYVDAGKELYALEADDFAATVFDGAPPAVSKNDSIGNMRVLDEIRKQIGHG
jgi:predicted dehydrogenase